MSEVETQPGWAQMATGRDETVIYYRRRNGWITWGDSQAAKLIVKVQKGCEPLFQFGAITGDSKDLWGPILRHPDGPAAFPLEQILMYRWYKDCPVKGVKFPQLAGVKITEFPCPENCKVNTLTLGEIDKTFFNPIDLGNHLRIMHGYDRSEILKYGEAMNIDFSKTPGGKKLLEFDFSEASQAMREVEEDAAEFVVESVSAAAPATAEVAAGFEEGVMAVPQPRLDCPDCGWFNEGNTAQGLSMHRRRWCKKQAVTA